MPWFKVDDSFAFHPKTLMVSDAAIGLWTRAGAWSSSNLTNGFVADGVLARLSADSSKLAAQLVGVGLWKRVRGGHQFHDWNCYQPDAETEKKKREVRREAGRKGGVASGKARSKPATKPRSKNEANASVFGSRSVEPPNPNPNPITSPYGEGATSAPTVGQRQNAIAKEYTDREPMSKFPAVAAIVGRAIKSNRYTDDQIRDAVIRLADEGRSVTLETMRVELDGFPTKPQQSRPRGSTTDDRVAQAQALKRPAHLVEVRQLPGGAA